MPLFQLTQDLIFPNPELAEKDGLLAIGGDLSPERLLLAYSHGIFPWYNEGDPILWWSLNPRLVLFLDQFKCSHSLFRTIKSNKFKVIFDSNFEEVIINCSSVNRITQEGTWICNEMIEAYINLYKLGFAHSVEVYFEDKIVGGLYGVSIGKIFMGESMFHIMTDASKVALFHLVEHLKKWDFLCIDAQQPTNHLISLGAKEIERKKYLNLLKEATKYSTHSGNWNI